MWSGASVDSQEKNVDKGEISLASLAKFFFRTSLFGCTYYNGRTYFLAHIGTFYHSVLVGGMVSS